MKLDLITYDERISKGEKLKDFAKEYIGFTDELFELRLENENTLNLVKMFNLKEDFIDKHFSYFTTEQINYLLRVMKFSDEFLIKRKHQLIWQFVIEYQKLNDNVLEECSEKLIWFLLPKKQKLSKKFILQNLNKLPKKILLDNQELDDELKETILNSKVK